MFHGHVHHLFCSDLTECYMGLYLFEMPGWYFRFVFSDIFRTSLT